MSAFQRLVAGTARFPLGRVVATPGALEVLEKTGISAYRLLARHQAGDWGELSAEDVRENEASLVHGWRLLSAYPLSNREKVWIITEADRSITTLLLPEEY